MTAITDRLATVAQWCAVAAAFTLALPVGAVGGFYLVVLAVGR